MKKILLITVFLCATVSLFAQSSYGVKAGFNASNIGADYDGNMKIGIYVGVFSEFDISNQFSIQPEVVYSRQGASLAGESNHKIRLNYINIPVLAKYYVMDEWSFEAGPQLGVLLTAKSCTSSDGVKTKEKINNLFSTLDFGLALGTSYLFMDNIGASLRYNIGISNISSVNGLTMRNGVLQLGAFVQF